MKGSHIILSFFTFLAASSSSSSPLSHLRPPNTSSIHQQQQREQHEMVEVENGWAELPFIQFGTFILLPFLFSSSPLSHLCPPYLPNTHHQQEQEQHEMLEAGWSVWRVDIYTAVLALLLVCVS